MRMALRILLLESLLAILLFTSAGRLDLPWFWAMLAVHGLMVSIMMYLIPADLRQERMRPGPGERDRHLRLLLIPPLLLHLVVAGLDARFGWAPDPGPVVRASARLRDAATGATLWRADVDRPVDELSAIRYEIAESVAATMLDSSLREQVVRAERSGAPFAASKPFPQ